MTSEVSHEGGNERRNNRRTKGYVAPMRVYRKGGKSIKSIKIIDGRKPMKKQKIFEERERNYGPPEVGLGSIAEVWSGFIQEGWLNGLVTLKASDVAHMYYLAKCCRLAYIDSKKPSRNWWRRRKDKKRRADTIIDRDRYAEIRDKLRERGL